ncbi:MAG: YafY family protein [Planctomycetota bacterium]
MRRADRLFQLIELLRRRNLVTARELASELEVSERTVYRDIQDLVASGVPVEGEAGVGYVLRSFDLPPVMFDRDEIEALAFGMRIVESFGDSELARAARRALGKIEVVLPDERRGFLAGTPLLAHASPYNGALRFDLAGLRRAIRERRLVQIDYVDASERASARRIRPLALAFFGPAWLLMAWCELRAAFRTFRPDRIEALDVLDEAFLDEPGKDLATYVAALRAEYGVGDCDADRARGR